MLWLSKKHKISKFLPPILVAFTLYLIFFFPIFKEKNFFWGSDAEIKHFPVREYLHKSITEDHTFPFWTERVLFGFPLYADMENAYLNVVNVTLILLFGAVTSFKIIHLGTFLLGSFAFYIFLKRKGYGLFSYVLATCIYFFSFFHLNHLIHYNLISISMLLPLNILLADLFIEKREKKYIFFQALVISYGVYWGHPQITLLVSLSVLLYLLIIGQNLKPMLKLKYLIFVFLFSVGLSLPQLYPTFRLFLDSARNINEIQATQGSLTPELSITYVFPYIYSTWPYYYGKAVNVAFSYTELYNYLGIVALTLGFIYTVFGKKDKLFWFSYSLTWCFLILGYLRYIPALNNENLPILSYFRYWTRSVVLVSFALAIMSARIVSFEKLKVPKLNIRSLWPVLLPVVFLLLLHLINIKDPILITVHNSLNSLKFETILKRDILLWIILPITTFVLVYMSKKDKRMVRVARLLIIFVLILDLRYFGNDPLTYRIKRWDWDIGLHLPNAKEYTKRRVIEEGSLVLGMRPLLSEFYTPYGYSQFVSEDYYDFFMENSLGKTPRASYSRDFLREDLNLSKLKNYGVTLVRTEINSYQLRDPDDIGFVRDEIKGEYFIKEEGHLKFRVDVGEAKELYTTVKYDPNWVVKVNGEKVIPRIWDNAFIKLDVQGGENVVEFKYFPYDIAYGFGAGSLLVFSATVLLKRKNQ